MTGNSPDLTSHKTNLRKLSGCDLAHQFGCSVGIHLEAYVQHIQGAAPMVVVAPVVQELEQYIFRCCKRKGVMG